MNVPRTLTFKGFDDWVELFTTGTHIAADGSQVVVSEDTLTGIAKNFSAEGDTVPAVHGHPKHDSPAYGWLGDVKVEGDSLWGKFRDVEPTFAQGVADKRYPNRSIKMRALDDGSHQLVHVGWLGGVAPAVKNLKPVEFASGDGVELTFMTSEEQQQLTWSLSSAFRAIGRLFSKQKTLNLIEYGEKGDVLDDWDLQTLASTPGELEASLGKSFSEPVQPLTPTTTQPQTGPALMELSQEELDRRLAEARDAGKQEAGAANAPLVAQVASLNAELATKTQAEDKQFVDGLIAKGKLLPAQAAGLTEFMSQLDGKKEFEFSVGDGDKAQKKAASGRAWFRQFMEQLPKQMSLGQERCGDDDVADDDQGAEKLAQDIKQFMGEQAGKGITVSVTEAKRHVLEQRK